MLLMEIPSQKPLSELKEENPKQRLITRQPRRKRRPGRPKGKKNKIKPCRFELTPAGYILCHQCETEWATIRLAVEDGVRLSYNLVRSVSYSSGNPVFQTTEWRKALIDYRRYGLRTPNAVKESLDNEIRHLTGKLGGRLGIF